MIVYTIEGRGGSYGISYSELKEQYYKFIKMDDDDFLANLAAAAHFACIVGWFKEIGIDATIGDTGIVHELIHLIHIPDDASTSLLDVRRQFKELLLLA